MQKTVLGSIPLMFVFVILVCGSTLVAADGMIIPEHEHGEEIVGYPEIRYHKVTVDIENQYAVTEVDQKFYNSYDRDLVGTYIFPVPEGASVSDFQMVMEGKTYPTEVLEQEEAEALFEEAVVNHEDASLLKYIDQSIISCEVTIPALESREMKLKYEEILTKNNGMYRYAYTLSTERYSSADIDEVSVDLNIKSDKMIESVYSPTHEILVDRISPGNVFVSYKVENARPDTDFELFYTVSDDKLGAGLITYEDENGDGYFMFMFAPNMNHFEDLSLPKDIVFVTDQSGSMSGDKIVQSKSALKYIVSELAAEDRFSIIKFNNNIDSFSTELLGIDSSSRESALDYIENISAGGGTNINDALLDGISILGDDWQNKDSSRDSVRVIVFLTDGLPTAGVTNEQTIVDNVRDANSKEEVDASIYVFGLGYDVNTHLLDKIAGENNGISIYIEPDESVETSLTDFYSRIATPLLTDISIEYDIEVTDVYPQVIPDIYKGSEIILVGRYENAERINIKVTGNLQTGEQTFTHSFIIRDDSKNDFVPRIWATRKIGNLMNKIRLEGETDELVEEVKTLGLKYGIVTPYTSMMIEAGSDTPAEDMANASNNGGLYEDSGKNSVDAAKVSFRYESSDRASISVGANIVVSGGRTFVNIEGTLVEMVLLGDIETIELGNLSAEQWIVENIDIDSFIVFGSEEYFELATDKGLGEILQGGKELVFSHNGEILAITTGKLNLRVYSIEGKLSGNSFTITWKSNVPSTSTVMYRIKDDGEWQKVDDFRLTTNHKITLDDLEKTNYQFYIISSDKEGNESTADKNGEYYSFEVMDIKSTSDDVSTQLNRTVLVSSIVFIIVALIISAFAVIKHRKK